MKIDPNYKGAWLYKGISANELKKYKNAIIYYDKALEIIPNHPMALANKGKIFLNLERYEKAIDLYDRALEIDPNNTYEKASTKAQGFYDTLIAQN